MTFEERLAEVKRMDEDVRNFNDEELIEPWLMCGVPDGACEEDYEWFAEDEDEFQDLVALYNRLVRLENAAYA